MKLVNAFNLVVMMAVAFFTWSAVAEPMKVHVLDNLNAQELTEVNSALVKLGYLPSSKSLFSESHHAIIVTKELANEQEPASISLELVNQANEKELPKTVFQTRFHGNDIHAMIQAFPGPEAFRTPATAPMAFQKSE